MVFFTCNYCGSALKKNRVEKHYATECRKPPAVSCMDCSKDFYGQEYVRHNKCISEEQKYSGQPSDCKVVLGKGEKKQMEWVETVRQIIETKGSSLTSQERQLLESLKDFENIPRKKKKFENFLNNAMGRYIDQRTFEKVWSLLEGHKSAAVSKETPNSQESTPSSTKEPKDNQPDVEGPDENSHKETSKLSKKERKEKKKKQKYELELESISKENQAVENNGVGEANMNLDQGENQDEGNYVKSKKNKKRKKEKQVQAEANVEAAEVNVTKGVEKKKGKRKHAGNAEDESGDKKRVKGDGDQEKGANRNGGVIESDVNGVTPEDAKGKGKFKWNKTIVSILETVPDNELLVKRLRKKVLAEYQAALGEGKCQELTLEEAMGMFDRKLHKIPGVKVHKDKAKLVKSS